VAVIKGAFFLCLAPEDLVVAVRVKRRVDINQVNAFVGEFFQLFEVIAAINDAGIDERGGFGGIYSFLWIGCGFLSHR
jgi:hypothetical protein